MRSHPLFTLPTLVPRARASTTVKLELGTLTDQQPTGSYARHYFDMVKLLGHGNAVSYLANRVQCQRVVNWKARVFARSWARYDLAAHGSFRLTPPLNRQRDLAQDYATMQPMFLTEPPPFAELMRILTEAEEALNAL